MTQPGQSGEPLSPLKLAFLKLQEAEARIRQLEGAVAEPIAIVGIGCRIPGAEQGPNAYWRLLRDRRSAVSAGLEQRLRAFAGVAQLPDSARRAALLERVDWFDARHFGISPREAEAMDPQQRLLLEVSWEALEHAGIDPDTLYQTKTGVYIGIAAHDYAQLQTRGGNLEAIHPYFASGAALSVAAGRIAYTLGLNGPAISIDTACSSSLVAVHLACEALRRQECTAALAGGVNLILSPEASMAFAQTGMLSPRGICSVFDNSADGFVRGEGCGIVVLRRLTDAQAAGDRVLAVIVGSALNQDGASSGMTAPNGLAQQALLREAHRRAGIEPWQVGYVEAHGTGTKLGDPVEAEALGAVFAQRPERLPIGSVKANIGHLEAAAGIAGLIRLVLSLQRGEIPGQIEFERPSEHIRWGELPLDVPTKTRAWLPIAGRRLGGVSSFGFSGTNAHVVVEGWPCEERQHDDTARPDVLTISAGTEAALRQMAEKYASYLKDTEWGWGEICHTAGAGRAMLAERLAVVADSPHAAAEQLSAWLKGESPNGVYRGHAGIEPRESQGDAARLSPEAVAELFVQGRRVDWQRRGQGRLRRTELPTYAFQREHYWFEERSQESSPADEAWLPTCLPADPAPQKQDLRLLVATVSAEDRLGIIRNYLRDELKRNIGMDAAAEIEDDRSLSEVGMDSLMALELKNRLQQSSGSDLPGNFLFEYSTIGAIAAYLNAVMGTAPNGSPSQDDPTEYEDIAL
jgi:acyl transferase domain-containing protein